MPCHQGGLLIIGVQSDAVFGQCARTASCGLDMEVRYRY